MMKRFLSMMLALLMAFGTFGIFCTIPVSVAAEEVEEEGEEQDEAYVNIVGAALTTAYKSAQDKIDSDENMRLAAKYGYYELYINDYTGEIALKDITTGEILTSNPYDAPANTTISGEVRAQLLSQVVVGYTDNGNSKVFYSYTEAANKGQIKVKNIKNGVRVEYALGREDANYLVPGMITEERMISEILSVMDPLLGDYSYDYIIKNGSYDMVKFLSFYVRKDPTDTQNQTQDIIDEMLEQYPVLKTLQKAVYIRSKSAARDKRELEGYIKTYCPDYSYEELEKDHAETQYVSDETDPPLFKLALEYTLNDQGMAIRLPANSIRFNASLYTLEYVTPLPYFSAGDVNQEGYIFYPDGSGAILDYKDLTKAGTITGKVYGADYAYHQISGKHQETVRMPVFGLVRTTTDTVYDVDGVTELSSTTTSLGYLAILEEGDAMANITAAWGGSSHNYASVYTTYYPRPKDSYNLSASVSAGSNSSWTVESSRKYTGSYKLRIIMLSDRSQQPVLNAASRPYYEATYVGMAKAYSNYLVNVAKVLAPLSASDVKAGNIPLYIESFGTVPDMQRFLSIPVEVDVPLTTFENVKKMYEELSANGISNVNFKLTGFANEGMYSTYPAKLDWMWEVGGWEGFSQLLAVAKQKDFGIYPEFDFMYISNETLFDGVSLRDAGARTIDNRYSSKRVYDATYQDFVSYYQICVTPAMIKEYYQNFSNTYKGFDPIGISVSTLGSDLNSDFSKKTPTNREDAKKLVSEVLAQIEKDYGSVMTSGGNVYTLKYTEHLLEAALDSSRFASASRAIPFVGMVLHGYVNFAGSAINTAGNVNYQVLKAIESGAAVYFTLSYQNTSLLKEFDDLSDYYSVNYKIWAGTYDSDGNLVKPGDLFSIYNRVNDALGNLQTAKITDHNFIIGERVPSASELAADAKVIEDALAAAEAAANDAARKAQLAEYREKYANGEITAGMVIDAVATDEEVQAIFDSYGIADTTTTSDALAGKDYVSTKYTQDDGMIVLVTYEGGHAFILNYNVYDVQVTLDGTTYTLPAYGYQAVTR